MAVGEGLGRRVKEQNEKKKKGSFNRITLLKRYDEKNDTLCTCMQTITWQLTHRTRHFMASGENG